MAESTDTASDETPKKVFAQVPKDFYEMTDEEQDAWCLAFVDHVAAKAGITFTGPAKPDASS